MLEETVLKNDFCIGCGNCANIDRSPFSMTLDQYGKIIATNKSDIAPDADIDAVLLAVCPFSGSSKSETEIGSALFPESTFKSEHLGNFEACFGGHLVDGEFRAQGTSGGMGKWIGAELLATNEVDYFIQVGQTDKSTPLFTYKIFAKDDDVLAGSKACYYPVTLDNVYTFIQKTPGRYAITAIPCFAKAIRLMQDNDELFKDRIKYVIGLICGGLKTANYSKFISMQYPIPPDRIQNIDFRKKTDGSPARVQASQITYVDDNNNLQQEWRPNYSLKGLDYGMGLFKPKACDYCDDVVAETSDVSVGDAWLPEFVADSKGDSIIVVRNRKILAMIEKGINEGRVVLRNLNERDVIASQAAGFRQRREGLVIRVNKAKNTQQWVPEKRDFGVRESAISNKRKQIYLLRESIAAESHDVFLKSLQANSIDHFLSWLNPVYTRYKRLSRPTFFQRVLKKISKGRLGGA